MTEIDHVEVSDGVQILTDDDESRSQSLKSSRQLILRLEGTFLETGSERVPVEPAEAIVRRPVVRRGWINSPVSDSSTFWLELDPTFIAGGRKRAGRVELWKGKGESLMGEEQKANEYATESGNIETPRPQTAWRSTSDDALISIHAQPSHL